MQEKSNPSEYVHDCFENMFMEVTQWYASAPLHSRIIHTTHIIPTDNCEGRLLMAKRNSKQIEVAETFVFV